MEQAGVPDDASEISAAPFAQFLDSVVRTLMDPITLEIMVDPVTTSDNISYDRESIEQWFMACHRQGKPITSPVTNQPLTSEDLRPNVALKSILDSTMKYLEEKHNLGTSTAKEQEILARFRAFECEKALALAFLQEEENRMRSINLLCYSRHQMIYYRKNSAPRIYGSSATRCTIICDVCNARNIHFSNCFYNCEQCHFDVCRDCAVTVDIQNRIDLMDPRPAGMDAHFMDSDPDFRELVRMLQELNNQEMGGMRRVVRASELQQRTGREPNSNTFGRFLWRNQDVDTPRRLSETVEIGNEAAEVEQHEPRRRSGLSRFLSDRLPRYFTAPFRGSNRDVPRCLLQHDMVRSHGLARGSRVTTVVCDSCSAPSLETLPHYYHCNTCHYDLCSNCGSSRLQNPHL